MKGSNKLMVIYQMPLSQDDFKPSKSKVISAKIPRISN